MSDELPNGTTLVDLEADGTQEAKPDQQPEPRFKPEPLPQAQDKPQPQAQDQVQPKPEQQQQQQGAFSWLDPHPIFAIILVSPEQQPFGIQKDFLCARSSFYSKHFADQNVEDAVEHILHLPDVPIEVFRLAQNYLFTGEVFPKPGNLPSYEVLIGVWKLGHRLGIDGLCEATLEAMAECRRQTQSIPATPLLVQVWEDTPEDSSIRKLLLSWAAEYMRSSDSRAEFARSLPQGVLSELVVAMSSPDMTQALPHASLPPPLGHGSCPSGQKRGTQHVHYINAENGEEISAPAPKRQRHSDVLPNGSATKTAPAKKATPRTSLPAPKPTGRRRAAAVNDQQWSTEQKLSFCSDLITRMLSGPGFWTRLVGPFKEPVDPVQDGVPDYFEKVLKPMDLGTMKAKMDRGEYADEEQFLADMNQIFTNCYTYWTKKDPMWAACERLQKTFEEKYSQMSKWLYKMSGDENH